MAIICLIAFVCSLFFVNGPWVYGFFTKGTSIKSYLFNYRRRDPDFDGKSWLLKHP